MRVLATALFLAALASAAAADALRDPTRPPPRAVAGPRAREAGPALSAVFNGGERRSAIFNGRLVKAGDRVGDYLIEEVLADGVRYRHDGVVRELTLPHSGDPIKKPAAATPSGAGGGQ